MMDDFFENMILTIFEVKEQIGEIKLLTIIRIGNKYELLFLGTKIEARVRSVLHNNHK